ncbi:hypothetical protein M409DRAFT_59020 [Zasmidium cellare ATCC 36951]|uniref:AHC1-like C2H2 zinc-finger domain-containing protein n=1 Tax=Zasmidium cellare ATCC 36951 TaxID=1080233 RepID=A0A6A6C887_ZASCE|nr:uncharacterized protein M409DRAFT_59020 [Zasmidium cellare ATCC 36951]KAF2161636.1 hypothetical protein M409DRAFT_59020 [Zasmidium cellare ATCC 36951]
MQSIFRLPWCSDQLKLSEKAALDKMRPSPVVEIPVLNKLKRKRDDSPDSLSPQYSPQTVKRQRSEAEISHQLPTPTSPYVSSRVPYKAEALQNIAPAPQPVNGSVIPTAQSTETSGSEDTKLPAHSQPTKPCATTESEGYFTAKHSVDMPSQNVLNPLSDLTPLQQVIENEFNMQILMKHNELRLIEQELAKCQVALEQLRRCELRPYPGTSGLSASVTEGTGPAVAPPPGFTRPIHAAPHGVTDGPYSRHYRQWLLHDPQFDSLSPQILAQAEQLSNLANRSTRNNGQHSRKTGSKSLGTSTRASESLHSIPNYPAVPAKDKSAPLVLKRSTDHQLVKLICNDCKRGNFSSIQGFLNHCRIAHKVDYKSHDAAAVDCGQLLDEQELANLPPEAHSAPAPKPTPAPRVSTSSATVKNSSFVHPLNTPSATPVTTPRPVAPKAPVRGLSTPATTPGNNASTFKPSPQVPRLSAYFAKHNVGGDLEQAAAAAKQKVDLGVDEDLQSPDASEANSPIAFFGPGARTLAPSQGGRSGSGFEGFERPTSRKGQRQPMQRPRPSPLAPTPAGQDVHMTQSGLSSPQDNLSPHTADSNPGLVSDNEGDHDDASDDESSQIEVAAPRHPLPPVGRSCEDNMDIDVQEDDEIERPQRGVIIRRNSMLAQETSGMGSPSRKVGGK